MDSLASPSSSPYTPITSPSPTERQAPGAPRKRTWSTVVDEDDFYPISSPSTVSRQLVFMPEDFDVSEGIAGISFEIPFFEMDVDDEDGNTSLSLDSAQASDEELELEEQEEQLNDSGLM
jgi:hypothetical protein